jgi:chemotaxis response regulator CheB
MIRVIVAEDHGIVRAGLEQLLANADDIELVASAAGGEEAIALTIMHRPDVILMDLSMPGTDGIAATREIVHAAPEVRVAVLTRSPTGRGSWTPSTPARSATCSRTPNRTSSTAASARRRMATPRSRRRPPRP